MFGCRITRHDIIMKMESGDILLLWQEDTYSAGTVHSVLCNRPHTPIDHTSHTHRQFPAEMYLGS